MKIEIYSGKNCHFCTKAKDFFASKNLEYIEYDVKADSKLFIEMKERCMPKEVKTIPQIFINDDYIGGCDDLMQQYNQGYLSEKYGI